MLRAGNRAGRDVERLLRDGIDPPGGDGSLLRRFLETRDESAFETIVDRHGPLVMSLCKRYLREPADVEDAFQATFLVLARKGAGLCEAETLAGWLHGVAHRVAFRARSDVLRRRSREGERDGVQEATAAEVPADDDSLGVLNGELARLPEKYRAPLVLCYLRGKTHDQAAAELGWPVGTVRSRMAKARSILHDRLSRRGLDASACLAAARLDLASAVVPSSLVAATASAAGRFAALAAGLGWIWRASPSSTHGPEALAEGVLSTMTTLTPWKLLGFAFLSTGLTAGALALAAGPASTPPKPEEPPAQGKDNLNVSESARKSLEDRMADLEQKLTQMLSLLQKQAAEGDATTKPAAVRPKPDPVTSPVDTRNLREIEAQLVSAYRKYKISNDFWSRTSKARGFDSPEAAAAHEEVIAPARILVARLREFEDESTREQTEVRRRVAAGADKLRAARTRLSASTAQVEDWKKEVVEKQGWDVKDLEKQAAAVTPRDVSSARPPAKSLLDAAIMLYQLQERLVTYAEDVSVRENEQATAEASFQQTESRLAAIRRLLDWAREHFKDVELTIDDAAKS